MICSVWCRVSDRTQFDYILNFVSCLWFLQCSLWKKWNSLVFCLWFVRLGVCVCVCVWVIHIRMGRHTFMWSIKRTVNSSSVHGYSCLAKKRAKNQNADCYKRPIKFVRHTDILKTCVKNVRQNSMKMYWYVVGK